MKLEEVKKTAVVGAGLMGSQIAEILSRVGGYEVKMVDTNDELVGKGFQAMADRLERFFVDKGKMTAEEKEDIVGRIKGSTSIEEAVKDVDFVIEAVLENLSLKRDIFRKLDESTPPQAILASNTSYQNISEMALATKRPERVVRNAFLQSRGHDATRRGCKRSSHFGRDS